METAAFSMSGVVQGIVWALVEVLSCKTGGRSHCAFGLLKGTRWIQAPNLQWGCSSVPSLMHTEADEAVDSQSIWAAAEGSWLLPVPKGSFPAPLPQETLENPRTIQEFGLEGTSKNHPLLPPTPEVLTA